MRTTIGAAIILIAVPALAADAPSQAPPSPPAVAYDVWGFRWDGHQYVKQATHCYSTTDLQKGADYATEITGYAGWSATTNLPEACVVHTFFHGPVISSARPAEFPDKPTYTVWAFKLTDGHWVKDEKHSWTTANPLSGREYAKKVNAVSGWAATDNCPDVVPQAQRFVDGGTVRGAEQYKNYRFGICDTAYGPVVPIRYRQYATIWSGWDPNWTVQSNSIDSPPAYDNWSDIQNMINMQNMINTQNMLNNIQDMVNTQNMINTQNMVNAMQANP